MSRVDSRRSGRQSRCLSFGILHRRCIA